MPKIFDNIEAKMQEALKETLKQCYKADFCVGYLNMRGWNIIADAIEKFTGGDNNQCRLLIGMSKTPLENLRLKYSINEISLDDIARDEAKKALNQTLLSLKEQLLIGIPDDKQEESLRKLLKQLKSKKVVVKVYLKNLHAKLYLGYRKDYNNPIIPYLGSSNLTMAGLISQGELNVDVLDPDAAKKLSSWFENRWTETNCRDITEQLIELLENSWCKEEQISPYYVYLKMAYHIAQEAREGLTDFTLPRNFKNKLFDFQQKAVLISANKLNKHGGVLIGDVVGLGKTITACAVAKVFENDQDTSCLILCPANLKEMWQQYIDEYELRARVLSVDTAPNKLPDLRRYRLIIIDESHNLRNKDGVKYNAVRDYIQRNDSKVILLSATPYNKSYKDLSAQLRLFINDDEQLPARPENLINEKGEIQLLSEIQSSANSILAFEKSEYAEDWQELLRYYMVRRTRSFIKENYTSLDETCNRKYLEFPDGRKSYFPIRTAKSLKFKIDDNDKNDQYAKLYSKKIVDIINSLELSRYGLAKELETIYQKKEIRNKQDIPDADKKIMENLSRAGKEILGFCRTNLFKRLESCGYSFMLSLQRHILRNNIFIYALENNLPLPIGSVAYDFNIPDEDISDDDGQVAFINEPKLTLKEELYKEAKQAYQTYKNEYNKNFKWLDSKYFKKDFLKHLLDDNEAIGSILKKVGNWNSNTDNKLKTLYNLLTQTHKKEKVLIFTQYADTAYYLKTELNKMGIENVGCATGQCKNPTELAQQFSPKSNKKTVDKELRVLIATDVLSEGQNLQDSYIIVNFDLPWAIIKLIQRAGRVDRIGQESQEILCYNFLPADGVEKIIELRAKLKVRLKQNAEVVGTDENFFDDEDKIKLKDLYNEKSEVLDEEDIDIDLASYAYQIWKNATDVNPKLKEIIPRLSDITYSTKKSENNEGVIVYTQTGYGNDILSFVDKKGDTKSYSQFKLLKLAECKNLDKPVNRIEHHHDLVKYGVKDIVKKEKLIGGQLGKKSSTRFRLYQRLIDYAKENTGKLFDTPELHKTIDEIYKFPLTNKAKENINRQLKSGINDYELYTITNNLREEEALCITNEEITEIPPRIICSMGLNKE